MKILNILNNEFVEILWIDDSETELIPIQEAVDVRIAHRIMERKINAYCLSPELIQMNFEEADLSNIR